MPRVIGGPITSPFAQVAAQIADEALRQQALDQQAAQLHAQTRASVRESQMEFVKLQQAQDHWQAQQETENYWKGLDFDLRYAKFKSEEDAKAVDQYLRSAGIEVDKSRVGLAGAEAAQRAEEFNRTQARLAFEFQAKADADAARAKTAREWDEQKYGLDLAEKAVKMGIVPERPGSKIFVQIQPTHPLYERHMEFMKQEDEKREQATKERDRKLLENQATFMINKARDLDREVTSIHTRLESEKAKWLEKNYMEGEEKLRQRAKTNDKAAGALAAMEAYLKPIEAEEARAIMNRDLAWNSAKAHNARLEKEYGFPIMPAGELGPGEEPKGPPAAPSEFALRPATSTARFRSAPQELSPDVQAPAAAEPAVAPVHTGESLALRPATSTAWGPVPPPTRAEEAAREAAPGGSAWSPLSTIPGLNKWANVRDELERDWPMGGKVDVDRIAVNPSDPKSEWFRRQYGMTIPQYKELERVARWTEQVYTETRLAIQQHPEMYANPDYKLFMNAASNEKLEAMYEMSKQPWFTDLMKYFGLKPDAYRKAISKALREKEWKGVPKSKVTPKE